MDTLVDLVLGKNRPYIAYAVPVFFLLIGVELFVSWRERRQLYRFNDSINDLSCGILQIVSAVFTGAILFASYLFLYERFGYWDMQSFSPAGKWTAAFVLFLGVDCCYYWFHRMSHEMNGPWAAHAVHHQSEEYNLAVALRQGTFQPFFSWVFYLPLALLGFPPVWFAAMSSFNTLYQFWIHTRRIGKLGPLEWVLNTPSHHRVHHGRNPKYLDKNHAGTLIIWDRMFGTFQEEEEEPVYGIVRPLASWNPVWANFHEFAKLWADAKAAPYFIDKIKVWYMPPGWRPRGLPERPPVPEVSAETVVKYDTPSSLSTNLYVAVHFVIALALGVYVMISKAQPKSELAIYAILCTWALLNLGGLFERRAWMRWSEPARLVAMAILGVIAFWDLSWLQILPVATGLLMAASLVWFAMIFRTEKPVHARPESDDSAIPEEALAVTASQ